LGFQEQVTGILTQLTELFMLSQLKLTIVTFGFLQYEIQSITVAEF